MSQSDASSRHDAELTKPGKASPLTTRLCC